MGVRRNFVEYNCKIQKTLIYLLCLYIRTSKPIKLKRGCCPTILYDYLTDKGYTFKEVGEGLWEAIRK